MTRKTIPVFFATDDNYAPLLAVALRSLLQNASADYFYDIHVLTRGFNEENTLKIKSLQDEKSNIVFDDMNDVISRHGKNMHLRNYYSIATYFRLFIPELFPEYDKAIYFDSDMIFLGDISELFETDLGGKPMGAVNEAVMCYPVFAAYVEKSLDVSSEEYVNAGMLLMDLKALREMNFANVFLNKLAAVKYTVAQDQDYINVILKGKIKLLDKKWNCSAGRPQDCREPKVIHFHLLHRPWKYRGIAYEKEFWQYAENSGYREVLKNMLSSYTIENKLNDQRLMVSMAKMAFEEAHKASPGLAEKDFLRYKSLFTV